jgi:hypothetical protein
MHQYKLLLFKCNPAGKTLLNIENVTATGFTIAGAAADRWNVQESAAVRVLAPGQVSFRSNFRKSPGFTQWKTSAKAEALHSSGGGNDFF